MKLLFRYIVIFVISIFIVCPIYGQMQIPNKPNPPRLVNDFANLLNENEKAELEQKLVDFEKNTSNQIAVITVNNMNGYAIEDYSYEIGKKWGIGKAAKDNGIVLLVSMQEHKSRIEVGKGLEGAVPDLICAEITRNVLAPSFKQGNYYEGLNSSVDNLIAASKNEYQGDPTDNSNGASAIIPLIIFLVIFILLFRSMRRANNSYYMSRNGSKGWDTPWVGGGFLGGGSSGGSFFDGGGSSSGGGFGGFGGGGFGGGGASGSW